ncbi:hypothetical protein AN0698.2 [Aspergillus nidulans FGSC A4]|uniref:SH3 domain protein (AFU_orthologue AFUA_1G13610) n=1 Tax=Emericella nidulans (strain FGSC A4 / ATCC 38163 / CBS 112.46 / NRRL 194 / M139) TaxID=227321 RepID=Q5BFI2_EMENI|nr:hypothetical protein [Aspergillus nidulans FGSC A4]EAA65474.1 hypothetical protein AN0698.2 [Aspergillus nidulans FGSC A4]CBF88963.1 TPA: SH3 domain protein (AFU_orthologue; AFUA_1G13610) [Aspergillus nidulans FGSC A4]|eukprot:XP_658302.1 hypothetical protein AN0698.2 [Aspergillus nidulans FGSC A4]
MVHAHHHEHKVRLEERDPNPDGVTVYVTAEPTFTGEIGGYSTQGQDDRTSEATETESATKATNTVGVGAPVQQTRSTTQEEATTTTATATASKDEETTTTSKGTTTTDAATTRTKTTTVDPTEVTTTATQTQDDTDATSITQTTLSTITTSATDSDGSATSTYVAGQSTSTGSSAATVDSGSNGISSGAKAGIAIGVILGVGLIAGLIFFFIWKKKKKKKQQQGQSLGESDAFAGNEKTYSAYNAPPSPAPASQSVTTANAPQLNVRPVTQFAPDLTPIQGGATPVSAVSAAGALGSAAALSRNLTGNSPPQTPQSGVSGRDPFGDPVNPFGAHAEVQSRPSTAGNNPGGGPAPVSSVSPISSVAMPTAVPSPTVAAAAVPLPPSPSDPNSPGPVSPTTASKAGNESTTAAAAAAAAAAVAGAAAVGAAAQGSENDTSRPGSSDSDASYIPAPTAPNSNVVDPVVAPTAAAASRSGPGPAMPTNVHRVQMDFTPSMEDEMELRSGQLVRLLHEYDDGWALCVRLDRSQQGVVPRSCLSARPVKPRAKPPPGAGPGPGARGPFGPPGHPGAPGSPMMGPPGRMPQSPRFYPGDVGRPGSPSSRPRSPARAMSPAQGAYGPPPPHAQPQRPMSPAQFPAVPRSHSPGPRPTPPRSMSPGPYGLPGLQRPEMPHANQRQRSNSTGGAIHNSRAAPGPGSSPLAAPSVPPPAGALPAIPANPVPAPSNDA